MTRTMYRLPVVIGLIGATLAVSRPAVATLGESADSFVSDQKSLSARKRAKKVRVENSYTVHEIASDSVVLREYVGQSGVIFGIAWNGLIHPDLTQLLGSYEGEYRQALRETPRIRGRRYSQVKTGRAVVEKWGHMRNLQGRAYVPALIPPGVTANEIR